MLIGYARVSTDDQNTAAQVAALEAAGCERVFREKASGGRWERPQFLRLLLLASCSRSSLRSAASSWARGSSSGSSA